MTEFIKVGLHEGICTIKLARPEKKNALTEEMYGVLADTLERAERGRDIKVIVLQAEGTDFSAGNDLAGFAEAEAAAEAGVLNATRFMRALAVLSVPLLAAVDGRAIGIGATMLLHCDMVFVTPEARLKVPFINLGLVPEAASSRLLPARIGHARAFQLFAFGEELDGAKAVDWGIANALVPAEELRSTIAEVSRRLAALPGSALRVMKRMMRDSPAILTAMAWEDVHFARQLASSEAKAQLATLLAGRASAATGR